MPLLFAYGTLQDEQVQRATFGRTLAGAGDELPGYELVWIEAEDPGPKAGGSRIQHANLACKPSSRVSGTLFEITEAELEAADRYEAPAAYRRVDVLLASGKRAWVYLHAATTEDAAANIDSD